VVNLSVILTTKYYRIWLAAEAGLEDLEQVFNATESQFLFVISEDPLMAWYTLESRILDTSYDEILERQILMLEQERTRGQSTSSRYVR